MLRCTPVCFIVGLNFILFYFIFNVPTHVLLACSSAVHLNHSPLLELNLNQYAHQGNRAYLIHLLYLIKLLLAVALS